MPHVGLMSFNVIKPYNGLYLTTYMYMYRHIYIYIYIYMYVYFYALVCICICMYVCVNGCTFI